MVGIIQIPGCLPRDLDAVCINFKYVFLTRNSEDSFDYTSWDALLLSTGKQTNKFGSKPWKVPLNLES